MSNEIVIRLFVVNPICCRFFSTDITFVIKYKFNDCSGLYGEFWMGECCLVEFGPFHFPKFFC